LFPYEPPGAHHQPVTYEFLPRLEDMLLTLNLLIPAINGGCSGDDPCGEVVDTRWLIAQQIGQESRNVRSLLVFGWQCYSPAFGFSRHRT